MSEKLHPDYIWAWDILCAEFRPDPLPADAVEPEPVPAETPADQPPTDGVDDER